MLRKNDRGLPQAVQKPRSQGPSVFRKVKQGVEKIGMQARDTLPWFATPWSQQELSLTDTAGQG